MADGRWQINVNSYSSIFKFAIGEKADVLEKRRRELHARSTRFAKIKKNRFKKIEDGRWQITDGRLQITD